jgi:hypothetical protein
MMEDGKAAWLDAPPSPKFASRDAGCYHDFTVGNAIFGRTPNLGSGFESTAYNL